ncbi:MAG: PAS domain-containing protein, partial [Planktomarina sp.]
MDAKRFDAELDLENLSVVKPETGLSLSLLRNVNDCVKILGTDGRLKFMSENGLCLMELRSLEPIRGYFWWDLWPDDVQTTLKEAVERAANLEHIKFEAPCPTAKGTPKNWAVTVTPILDHKGA